MGTQIRDQLVATYQGVVDSIIAWTPRVLLAMILLISAKLWIRSSADSAGSSESRVGRRAA